MATDVDQVYYGWSHEELSERDESKEVSVSQMLDHGSISFGKFAFETLEWERRSVFTHNKCQEELEKFRSPGLVAQKKAYFEEYYKRIRALKAMQENQQAELILDYGGDGSISSQTGEEGETAVQLESLGNGASNVIDAHSKETSIAVTLEKNNCEAIQIRHLDLEPTSSNIDISRKVSVEIDQEKNNSYALQMRHLDTESTVHESLIRTEEIEQHDLRGFDDKGIPRKYDNLESTVKKEKNSSSHDIQIHHLESTEHESSIRRTEEVEQHELSGIDVKGISRKNDNLESNVEPEVAAGGTALYPTNPNAEDLVLKPDYNIVSEKTKPTVKKYKDLMPVSKVKIRQGPAASVSNGLKFESKTQSDIKSSQGSKYPFQKTINKAKNSVSSSNTTADRVSRSYKSTLVASHRPLTEVRSNVTIPRPFSFATKRRSAVPAGIRDGVPRLGSKTSNRLASSLNQAKDVINVQDTSKKAARNYGVKSRGLENKRGYEEVRKIGLTLDSQCASLNGRGANVRGPPKARISRSVDLSSRNLSNPHGGREYRCNNAVRKDKPEEGKEHARSREVRVVATKIVSPPRTGNLKAVAPSQTDQLSLNGRKSLIGVLTHDGTKPRQEMPRWQ